MVYMQFLGVNNILNMTLNFSSICRLCLGQKDGLLPHFGEDDYLPARIMTCAPVIKVILVFFFFTIERYLFPYHVYTTWNKMSAFL